MCSCGSSEVINSWFGINQPSYFVYLDFQCLFLMDAVNHTHGHGVKSFALCVLSITSLYRHSRLWMQSSVSLSLSFKIPGHLPLPTNPCVDSSYTDSHLEALLFFVFLVGLGFELRVSCLQRNKNCHASSPFCSGCSLIFFL
jgi:hypothetical protein